MGKSQTDSNAYVEILKKVPLIQQAKLDDGTITELASVLKEEEFAAGKNIIVEGDVGSFFYIVRSGEVKCTKGGNEVSRRKPGDFFGELALLHNENRAATVTAAEETAVLSLPRDAFVRLLGPIQDLISASTSYS